MSDGTTLAHADVVNTLAFSDDSKLLVSGSRDKTLKVWKANGDSFAHAFSMEFTASVIDVELQSAQLAVLINNELAVHVWHLEQLKSRFIELGIGW